MPTIVKKKVAAKKVVISKAKPAKSATAKKKKLIEAPKSKPVQVEVIKGEPVKRLLITQPKPVEGDRSPYFEIAKRFKINIEFQPFFEINGITAKEFRRYRIHLHEFTAVILTSRNSVDHFFRLLGELKTQMSSETKYFCTTESIALYLQKFIQYRKRKVFFGDGTTKDLLNVLNKHIEGESYLLPCSETPNTEIVSHLKKNKFKYFEAVLFRTTPSEIKHLQLDSFDMMVFFSPSAIEALTKNFPKFKQKNIRIGAFGPTTCLAVKESGFKLHIEAPKHGMPSMAAAIEHYLKMIK